MKTNVKTLKPLSVVIGSHTIKAFVTCPKGYKVLGIVRRGMEFGVLAITDCGAYVRVNGSAIEALDRAEVDKAIMTARNCGRGESYSDTRLRSAELGPQVVLRKHRHAEVPLRDAISITSKRIEMDPLKTILLREYWALIPWKSAALTGKFLIHLYSVAPEVQGVYATNKISAISGMLRFIGVAITMMDEPAALRNMLYQVGQRHVGYGVLPRDYPKLGAALMLTLEETLGDKFKAETRQAWAELYQSLTDSMLEFDPQAFTPASFGQLTLHLEHLLEDSGPNSSHIPLPDAN